MVSREAVLDKARGWLGTTERTGNNDVYFADQWGITGSPWCYAFVQSCFYEAGGQLPYQSMYVPAGIQYARDNGEAIEVGQGTPLPGDLITFSWDMRTWGRFTPGTGDHIGLVESYDGGGYVNTIEGNVGGSIGKPDGVWRFNRSLDLVVCFWRPSVYGSGGPFTISQPEDDMFDETIDRAALQQANAAAQALVGAVATIDTLLRDTFNHLVWVWTRLEGLTPLAHETLGNTGQTWAKLKDVDFTAPVPAPVLDSPPAADQSERLESLERRFTAIEQAIARLAGPRPPVSSPTAAPPGPT